MQKAHGAMALHMQCLVLLAASWPPCVLCIQPGRKIAVRFVGTGVQEEYNADCRVFKASGYARTAAEWMVRDGKDAIEITCDPGIFNKTVRALDGRPLGRVSVEDAVEILCLLEYLNIDEDEETACYTHMARATVELHRGLRGCSGAMKSRAKIIRKMLADCCARITRKARRLCGSEADRESWFEFAEKMLEEHKEKKLRSFKVYALQLLVEWAGRNGMCVVVSERTATLCTQEYHRSHQVCGSTARVGTFDNMRMVLDGAGLAVRGLNPEVLSLLRMVADVMDIPRIDVSVEEWKPEVCSALENIEGIDKLGRLEIACRGSEPGAISAHLRGLGHRVVGLDVSFNRRLNDSDWEAVGGMTALESLDITLCEVEPGTVATYFQGLREHLEELRASGNRRLSYMDWRTIGDMKALARLEIRSCMLEPETIQKCFRRLRDHLAELHVSGNRTLCDADWRAIGEMTVLRSLDVSSCDAAPGTISACLQGAKKRLAELDLSGSTKMSDADWRTVGEMTALVTLRVSRCDIKPGVVSARMQGLRGRLEDLDVSGNERLSGADWKTIGEMAALLRLKVSHCAMEPGTISAYLRGLGDHLEDLDVFGNERLSGADWSAIGEMAALRSLDMSFCAVEPGTISANLRGLRSHLKELYFSGNERLSEADWETIGEMVGLLWLNIRGCSTEPETVLRHIQGLRDCQLVDW